MLHKRVFQTRSWHGTFLLSEVSYMYRNCSAETNRSVEHSFLEQDRDLQDQASLCSVYIGQPYLSTVLCLLLSIQVTMAEKFVTVTWPSVIEQDKFNFSQSSICRQHRGFAFIPFRITFKVCRHTTHGCSLCPKGEPRAEGALCQCQAPCPETQLLWGGSLSTMPEERQMLQISTAHERFKTLFILPTLHLQTALVFFSPSRISKRIAVNNNAFQITANCLKRQWKQGHMHTYFLHESALCINGVLRPFLHLFQGQIMILFPDIHRHSCIHNSLPQRQCTFFKVAK